MASSNFSFIKDRVLQKNLDVAFSHILDLIPLIESGEYHKEAISSFRKTVIIHTASIVEALLFYLLDSKFSEKDIAEHYSSWELKNKKVLHVVSEGEYEVVAGDYRKIPGKGNKEKMNLSQICDFLKQKEVIDKPLAKKVHSLRKLRNEQHIGTHKKVKSYTKRDTEKAFEVARVVKEFAKDNT